MCVAGKLPYDENPVNFSGVTNPHKTGLEEIRGPNPASENCPRLTRIRNPMCLRAKLTHKDAPAFFI